MNKFRVPPPGTALDFGLRHLNRTGAATVAELRELMCVTDKTNPAAWLARAVKAGLIARGYYVTDIGRIELRKIYGDDQG